MADAPAIRILILEDESTDADLEERALRQGGLSFASKRVATRAAFIEALQSFTPDVVLVDYMLPDFDGLSAVKLVREKYADLPIIAVTGALGDEAAVALIKAGASDFILKDRMARLGTAVDTALAERAATRARVEAAAERLDLLERLVNVQEQERLRIARELHDQMGQNLTGLSLGLKRLRPAVQDDRGRETLHWLEALTAQIGRDLHRTAWELRPTSLDDVGLRQALETYVADWAERFGISVDLHAGNIDGDRFPAQVETVAYRVVQEAMTNVLKHAEATTVSLLLEHRGDWLQIIVEDNGKGFDLAASVGAGCFGLAGMRERLALIGGTLTVDTVVGGGTTLYFRIPLRPNGSGTKDAP
ncbi:MAG: response regulator [Stellaceae bacterium]